MIQDHVFDYVCIINLIIQGSRGVEVQSIKI